MSLKKRLTKKEYGCLISLCASFRSEDPYVQVGCAIEDHFGRIIAVGYNGSKEGIELDYSDRDNRRPFMIHAEVNALSLIERNKSKILYCTHSPCTSCAQNIVSHGIKEVVFMNEYSDESFKKIFDMYNISYSIITKEEKNNIFNCIIEKTGISNIEET